ncbi:hypothetical protein N1851_005922 [Merluccius polli]|uniref:Uncharacterized protein n=1 Tax=Merluccius polli TaxID=89951 RepID=A0AA47PAR9_MERPO|nr:hypothetical protein N1851_005922 [Merluccius polli]
MWKKIKRATEDKMSWVNTHMKYLPDGGTNFHKPSKSHIPVMNSLHVSFQEERRKGRRSSVSSQNCGHLPETPEEPCTKETGNAVSTLEERGLDRPQTAQPITPADEQVEIIKVSVGTSSPLIITNVSLYYQECGSCRP